MSLIATFSFVIDWETLENPHLKTAPGNVLTEHSLTQHVRKNNPEHKHKSKFPRDGQAQTPGEICRAAEDKVFGWVCKAFKIGHPQLKVVKAQSPNHVAITVLWGKPTGTQTIETPDGTFTFTQKAFCIIAHHTTGVVKNTYPSEVGVTADGQTIIRNSKS